MVHCFTMIYHHWGMGAYTISNDQERMRCALLMTLNWRGGTPGLILYRDIEGDVEVEEGEGVVLDHDSVTLLVL